MQQIEFCSWICDTAWELDASLHFKIKRIFLKSIKQFLHLMYSHRYWRTCHHSLIKICYFLSKFFFQNCTHSNIHIYSYMLNNVKYFRIRNLTKEKKIFAVDILLDFEWCLEYYTDLDWKIPQNEPEPTPTTTRTEAANAKGKRLKSKPPAKCRNSRWLMVMTDVGDGKHQINICVAPRCYLE